MQEFPTAAPVFLGLLAEPVFLVVLLMWPLLPFGLRFLSPAHAGKWCIVSCTIICDSRR